MKVYKYLVCILAITLQAIYCLSYASIDYGKTHTRVFNDSRSAIGFLQVWDITSEGGEGYRTFFATNQGLGVYDGTRWELYNRPGYVSILRALCFDSETGRMLSAGVNGFGYWEEDPTGGYTYTPIYHNKDFRSKSEEFWRIAVCDDKYWFQSRQRIVITDRDGDILNEIPCISSIQYLYDVSGDIMWQDGDRLFRYDGEATPMNGQFKDRIINIIRFDGELILILEREGLYKLYPDGSTEELDKDSNRILSEAKINGCTRFGADKMIISSTKSGFFIIDSTGKIIQTENDLTKEQTALCANSDANGNIWIGLDSGTAFIETFSPDRYLYNSHLGQVHSVCKLKNGSLLIGSNKGLFIYDGKVLTPGNLTGSVWNIQEIAGKTYISHDRGLFVYGDDGSLIKIYTTTGAFGISNTGRRDTYILASYAGLELMKTGKDGILEHYTRIKGYKGYTRKFAVDTKDRIWVGVSGDGFVRLTLSEDMTEVIETKNFSLDCGVSSHAFPFSAWGKLYLCCGNKAYSIVQDSLQAQPNLNNLLSTCNSDIKAICEHENAIWYICDHGISYIDNASGFPKTYCSCMEGIINERISPGFSFIDNCIAVGYRNGIAFSEGGTRRKLPIRIRHITANGATSSQAYDIREKRIKVPNDMNTIRIYLEGVPQDGQIIYRLIPGQKGWTQERADDYLQLTSLQAGRHLVEIRIPGQTEAPLELSVTVGVPWYISLPMLLVYILIIASIVFAVRRYYILREKQRISTIEKTNLLTDLRNKEKELASTTLLSSQQNALLNELKSDASAIGSSPTIAEAKSISLRLIRKIDNVLDDESTWNQSKDYFNTIYDGLIDRLLEKYPNLTKTDLKLCVYMKLNLSTKEIAELMSISPRSVEMARYRLRKKLKLDPKDSIISILK
ncbi:MAG: sigma-70 region 4 domain-containing protein [Bacteroidales bacterium]|nr:sigma-70 region 4 domain-containing protein [Bacteroidales bacterium]